MDVGKIQRKTGIPAPPAFGVLAAEIRYVFNRRAKTGGTDHGAVGAAQTARRYVVPTGVLEIALQEFPDTGGIHGPAHLTAGCRDCRLCCRAVFLAGLVVGKCLQYFTTLLTADLDEARN